MSGAGGKCHQDIGIVWLSFRIGSIGQEYTSFDTVILIPNERWLSLSISRITTVSRSGPNGL